jgi:hypothetical protein
MSTDVLPLRPNVARIPYISIMRFALCFKGLIPGSSGSNEARRKFDSYPIYLQQTVFNDDENMARIRRLEIGQRFFFYDTCREKGNKAYHRGNYGDAMKFYELGLSCLKWLEHKKPAADVKESKEEQKVDQKEATAKEAKGSVTKEDLKAKLDRLRAGKGKLKENPTLMTTFTDENVVLFNGEEITDPVEVDMSSYSLMSHVIRCREKHAGATLSQSCCCLRQIELFFRRFTSTPRC